MRGRRITLVQTKVSPPPVARWNIPPALLERAAGVLAAAKETWTKLDQILDLVDRVEAGTASP